MHGDDGGEGGPMSRSRTAEPPGTQRDTAADNDSAGTLPHQSDGANDVRSKTGMHLHREYDLLASEVM